MTGGPIHETAARGFERGAADYERGRPSYPDEAVALLVRELGIGPGRTVVDLAAGTGKLTRQLVPSGARLVAVEPVAGMRAELARAVPDVEVLEGTAESLPLADACADVVVVGQAFHWFDAPAALAEIGRVLRSHGGLGLVWNIRDRRVPLQDGLQRLMDMVAGRSFRYSTSNWQEALAAVPLWGPRQHRRVAHPQRDTRDRVRDRVASTSYVSALPDDQRAAVLERVDELLAAAPRDGDGTYDTAHLTDVFWCHRTV